MKPRDERWELFRTMGTDGNANPVQLWCWRHAKHGVLITPAIGFSIMEEAVAHAIAHGLKDEQVKVIAY